MRKRNKRRRHSSPKEGRLDSVKELLRDRNFRDLILEIICIIVGSRR